MKSSQKTESKLEGTLGVNKQDFLQVFQGSGIGKIEDKFSRNFTKFNTQFSKEYLSIIRRKQK